ncbi:MAG TPA: hypothetical protein VNT51_08575 [Miltoncostaeaceae bacterium]|nr:hypothetical protein [Miltoncostaeaceae bacterium]
MRTTGSPRLGLLLPLAVATAVPATAAGSGPDTTPPVVVVSGATGAWSSAASATVTATADDPGAGVASVEHRTSADGGATWTAPVLGTSVDVTAEGTTLVQFRATDNASNVSAWTSAVAGAGGSVRLDRTGPTAPGTAPDQVAGLLAWFDASDGSTVTLSSGAVTRWADRTGRGNDATQTTPANRPTYVTNARNGRAVVRFATGGAQWLALPVLTPRAILVAGRKQPVGDANVIVGASGMADSYLAFGTSSGLGNALAQNGPGAALAPSASEVAWQVVGGVDDGASITAYRNGAAGTPASTGGATWTVDGIAVNPTAAYRLAGDLGEVVLFDRVPATGDRQLMEGWLAWRWGTQAALPSGHPFATLAPGANGGSATWVTGGPRTVSVAGSSDALSGVSAYEHRTSTDGGVTWGAPQSGATVSVDAEGETLVQFRAVDGAGNASTWSPAAGTGAATVRIDRVAPSVSVSGADGTWTDAASVTVSASASDASSGVASTQYRTSVNGAAWSGPVTGTSVAVTAEGETLVQFRATDAAGNVGAWSTATNGGTGSVRIDRTGPTVPAVSGATGAWSAAASRTVTAAGATDAASGVAGYQSRRSTDGGSTWTTPADGASVAVSAEGETLVQFRAVDDVGNAGAWSSATAGGAGSVRLDRTAPAVPATAGGSVAWANAASATVTASGGADAGSGPAGHQWSASADGGTTWGTPQTGSTAPVSAEGETLVRFRAVDNVGNTSAWTTPATVRLDRSTPTVPVVGATGAWTNAATVTVTASPADTFSSVTATEHRLSTDGGASWSTPAAGTTVAVTDEGTTLVQFRATDAAGNTSAWTAATAGAAGSVRIDRTAPAVAHTGADGTWSNAASRMVTAAPTDAAAGVASTQSRVSDDGGATWSAPAAGASVTVTRQGSTLVQFRATDAAGNTSGWTAAAEGGSGSVRLDRTAPQVSVAGATGAWSGAAGETASASAGDALSGVAGHQFRTSADGGASWDAPQSGDTTTVTREGTTLVQFRALDHAGNTSPWSAATAGGAGSIRLDRTPPVVAVSGADGGWTNAASVTVTAVASDAGAGVAGREFRTSGTGGATWSAPTGGGAATIADEGETLVQFRATDAVGNTSAWSTATPGGAGSVRIDRAPPGAPLMIATPDAAVPANSGRGAVTISTARAPGDTRAVRVVVTQNGRLVHDGPFGTVRDEALADATLYRYQAVAYDPVGNVSPANEVTVTTPDRTPPAQPVGLDATGSPPRIVWGAATGSTAYRVLRDGVVVGTATGAAFTDTSARDVTPPVAPGGVAAEATAEGVLLRWMPVADRGTLHRYQVVATDAEGNTTASPEVPLETTAGGVTYEVARNGSPVGAAAAAAAAAGAPGAVTAAVALPPGMHELTVTAVDAAGNRSTSARLTVRGPDPGPTALTARPSTAFARPGERITFTAGAPAGAQVRWTFPDGRTLSGARVVRGFRAGTVTAQVSARLPDGLELRTQVTVVVDGTVPSLDAAMRGRSLRIVPQDTTGLASLTARIGRGAVRRVTGTTLAIPEGRHRVLLVATDAAGNTRRMTVWATVDTRGPTVTARAATRPAARQGSITWAARDGASGVAGVRIDEGPARRARGTAPVAAGRVAVLVATDRQGNLTRLAAPVPAPIRLAGLRDPGLQGKRGDRLLPGGGTLTGIRAVVLTEARARLVWAEILRPGRGSGRYDGAFRAAVARFQTQRRVREPAGRGVLGPATLRAMDRLARWGGWGASAGRG